MSVVSAVGYAYFSPSIMEIVDLANGRLLRLVGPACDYFGNLSVLSSDSRPGRCQRLRQLESGARAPAARRTAGLVRVRQQHRARALSPNDKQLAIANSTNDGQVTILDAATDRTLACSPPTPGRSRPCVRPDSALLATASIDHTVLISTPRRDKSCACSTTPTPSTTSPSTPTAKACATLDFDGTIRIWDACTDCQMPRLSTQKNGHAPTHPVRAARSCAKKASLSRASAGTRLRAIRRTLPDPSREENCRMMTERGAASPVSA